MKSRLWFRSSVARLALAWGVIVLLLVVLLQGAVYLLTRNALEREVQRVITAELDELERRYDSGGLYELINVLGSRADSWGRTGAVYLLADAELQPLAGNLTAWPRVITPQHDGEARFRIATATEQVTHPVRARIVRVPEVGWLLVGTDVSEMRKALRRFAWATLWGVVAITALIGLLGGWYAARQARRVRAFSATCDSIVHSDLSRRLAVRPAGDEFDQLGRTVNDMLERLEQQAVLLRATFGSIAHDLRTPLYRLRVRLEDALLGGQAPAESRELAAPALAELDRVQRTLGTLLEIARAESGGTLAGSERVDLAQLAREMFELYQPGMQEKGLTLRFAATGGAVMSGRRQLLAQLIANLLENVLKYVPAGGAVTMEVRGDERGVALTVSDDGPGIPAADRARAQEPFVALQKGADKPTGSGLGLSLVKAITRLHRGELTLGDNAPGLIVGCRFPPA